MSPSKGYSDSLNQSASQPGFSRAMPLGLCDPRLVTRPLWSSEPIWYEIGFKSNPVQLAQLWCPCAWDSAWQVVAGAGSWKRRRCKVFQRNNSQIIALVDLGAKGGGRRTPTFLRGLELCLSYHPRPQISRKVCLFIPGLRTLLPPAPSQV